MAFDAFTTSSSSRQPRSNFGNDDGAAAYWADKYGAASIGQPNVQRPGSTPSPSAPRPGAPSQGQNPYGNFNPNAYSDALKAMQGRDYGDWNDPRTAQGNLARSQAYDTPYLQALQNQQTQRFNEDSFYANFGEQQYLNRNQVGLDWAASGREDKGLNYAMLSGDRNYAEGQRQFDVTAGNQRYDMDTSRLSAEALRSFQQGQVGIGNREQDTLAARQRADASFQQGQLGNDSTKIANDFAVAQKQNEIDGLYKQGLISVAQRDAATNELRAYNENLNTQFANQTTRDLGMGNLQNDSRRIDNEFAVAQQQNQIDQAYKSGLISVAQRDAATNELRARQEFQLGRQSNANQRYATDVELQLGLGNQGNQRYATDVQRELGMYSNLTGRLQAENEFALGNRSLNNQEFEAQTGRLNVTGQLEIAQQQNQIDQMYKSGLLSQGQYEAQTNRLQQQSQQSQWQARQGFDYEQLAQQMQLERERLAQEKLQGRLNVFGRANQPNMAAWARQWG